MNILCASIYLYLLQFLSSVSYNFPCTDHLHAWSAWGENGYPYFVPDIMGNAWNFCPLSMMLAVGLSYMAFIMFRYTPSNLTLLHIFIINGCWILSSIFSAPVDMIVWFYPSFCLCGESHLLICECCTSLAFPE